jgi:Flp pilus assembly protein TadG
MQHHMRGRTESGRRRGGTRGQAIVEFALVLPIFMVMLVGMIDAGFALYSNMSVINAARDGARAAVTVDTTDAVALAGIPSKIENAAINAAAAGGIVINPGDVAVTCVAAPSHPSPCNFGSGGGTSALQGDSVKVTVSYTYHTLFIFLFGSGIQMDSVVQMVLDN